MFHPLLSNTNAKYDDLKKICQKNHITRLSFFGSILTDKFNDESDIDILIEISNNYKMGLIKMSKIERELSHLFKRKVDLRTKNELSKYFRDSVLNTSEVKHAE
ncbi:MAG: nucleotidyltransferase domain-containing protein [Candidatus Magnetomorum sp.]|nr:nucleotidyltransferase domain-containing protein [Candidatus Magnetomorum sp.]